MIKAATNTNTWIILWALWILALLVIGSPTFAATEEDAYVPDPHNAFEVSYSNVEETVTQALTEKGVADKVAATINGRKPKPIFAYNKPVTVEARGLKFDKMSGHWEGSLAFVAEGEVISVIPASGHFDEMAEVAVFKREMRPNDIISQNDVEIRDFSIRNIRANTVTDIASLIGKAPLRTISPYRPIRSEEVVNPSIIKKDAMVQMRYSLPGLEITTSGQAMTAGAKGDVINVRNVTSKRMVRAVIENNDTVTVLTPTQQTSQLTGGDYATH